MSEQETQSSMPFSNDSLNKSNNGLLPNLAMNNQNQSPTNEETWTYSNEREFIENLLCTRFNFFLVFYSLIIAGLATASNSTIIPIILILGTIISISLALVIYRSHIKLDIILNDCLKFRDNKSTHPAAIIEQLCKVRKSWIKRLFSVRWIIGWFVPLICCISLLCGTILYFLGCLRFQD
jgi:hypothetical protein